MIVFATDSQYINSLLTGELMCWESVCSTKFALFFVNQQQHVKLRLAPTLCCQWVVQSHNINSCHGISLYTSWVGNVMATVCAYIAICACYTCKLRIHGFYTLYIARIAVISNCAGWQLVYFRYMYHEYFSTADDKRPMRCSLRTNRCLLQLPIHYVPIVLQFQYQSWLSCMV